MRDYPSAPHLKLEGITQKNGRPYTHNTQGKIEQFWQTLKKHLAQNNVATLSELHLVLDRFRDHYNEVSSHRTISRRTPHDAYTLIPKATPVRPDTPDTRQVTYDIVGKTGTISLRHAGRLRLLGVGRENARTEIIRFVHAHHASVISHTGDIHNEYDIDPERPPNAKHPNPQNVSPDVRDAEAPNGRANRI